jgi:hypothetical protein
VGAGEDRLNALAEGSGQSLGRFQLWPGGTCLKRGKCVAVDLRRVRERLLAVSGVLASTLEVARWVRSTGAPMVCTMSSSGIGSASDHASSISDPNPCGGNKKGRPPNQESSRDVADTRRTLAYLNVRGVQRSGVTGSRPTATAIALMVWFQESRYEQSGVRPSSWKPKAPKRVDLMQHRARAIKRVCEILIGRGGEHVAQARAGEPVEALRLTSTPHGGPMVVVGLPGVYSRDWWTTLGLPGEASLNEAHDLVRQGAAELKVLDLKAADDAWLALKARLRASLERTDSDPWRILGEPDEAAICEEVARTAQLKNRDGRGDWGGEVKLRRRLKDIRTFEYQFDPAATGRKPLPAPRR